MSAVISPIEAAIELATWLHKFQRDFNGDPYILHPLRVMLRARELGGTVDEQIAAVLHDVVEDCGYPLGRIYEQFGLGVSDIVDAVSRRGAPNSAFEESYSDFIERIIAAGHSAAFVKEIDVLDNMGRLDIVVRLDPSKAVRLDRKYSMALHMLQQAKENQ